MLRAYRLIITNNPYAPENLWETEQPYIDNLSRSAKTVGHHMKQRFFLNEKALNWENLRIWHTPPITLIAKRGEFVSVREAVQAAGWRKTPTAVDRMRTTWEKATDQERQAIATEVMTWLLGQDDAVYEAVFGKAETLSDE